MQTLEPQDLGWVAGFYEGEASIAASGGKRGVALQITIAQKDPEPLYRLQALTGIGNINGPCACRTTHVWATAKSSDVTDFIHAIFPLLSTRRQRQIFKAVQRANTGRRKRKAAQ